MRHKPTHEIPPTHLDYVLLRFPTANKKIEDVWTLRDAARGVQIFGSIGSGKSSGSGYTLAMKFLKSGYGGIVLTGKLDETKTWVEYAKEAGREDDLIVFSPEYEAKGYPKHKFNFLEYERATGKGGTDNIVALFMSVAKMGHRLSGGGSGEPFWEMAMKRCIKAAVDFLDLQQDRITIPQMIEVIQMLPGNDGIGEIFKDLKAKLQRENDEGAWEKKEPVVDMVQQYFEHEFPSLAPRTRSSILEHFYALANPFRSGLLKDYFAGEVEAEEEIFPELTFTPGANGRPKIIVLDFPVKDYLDLGIYAQTIYKRMWQQAVERRSITDSSLPTFLWVDESQYFLNEEDMMFQTTARSMKACTVMITQNISNYFATIGGRNPRDRVNSLLGNLVTKIFHANNDYVTNEWASNTIGKTRQKQASVSSRDSSVSQAMLYQVDPHTFTILDTGGEADDNQVTAIITGKKWVNGENYLEISFRQKKI